MNTAFSCQLYAHLPFANHFAHSFRRNQGTVIGFNVRVDKKVQHDAHLANVPIKSYNIIYKLLDDVKLTLGGLLPPIVTTQVKGEATVQQVFQIGTKGRETKPVAGCKITNGSMTKNGRVRIIRDKKQIWEGETGFAIFFVDMKIAEI